MVTVLYGLLDILGRAQCPAPEAIGSSCHLEFGPKVNVRVPYGGRFQLEVTVNLHQDAHGIMMYNQNVIYIT